MTESESRPAAPDSWNFGRYVFFRCLGVCFLLGFVALYKQAPGLVGERGFLPLSETMPRIAEKLGSSAWWRVASLFWFSTSDDFIRIVSLAGVVSSALLLLGVAPRLTCLVAWLTWRSFVATEALTPGYFIFDWPYDRLLEEAALIGMFFAPPGLFPRPLRERQAPRIPRLLLYLVLFRLVFGPGITKLQSAHVAWLDGLAIQRFLETVPSPTPSAAFVIGFPAWTFPVLSWFTLAYELVAPFLFFWPGRVRRWTAVIGIFFMVGLQLIGNFRGFNIMTVGLMFLLLDDGWLLRFVPASVRRWWDDAPPEPALSTRWRTIAFRGLGALVLLCSIRPLAYQLRLPLGRTLDRALYQFESLHLSATYSMFCAVPVERRVIVLQGSRDGKDWQDYHSIGVPVRVDRAPVRIAPYQDYLGFIMWRDAIKPPWMCERWLPMLQRRVLEGAPETFELFAEVPFRDAPPRYVRTALYRYHYAPPERRAQGIWWERDFRSWFSPVRTLGENGVMLDLSPETLEPLPPAEASEQRAFQGDDDPGQDG